MKPVVWIKIVLGSVSCVAVFCIGIVYYLDPYGIYSEKKLYHSDLRGSVVGIAKNAKYDSVIIGSSMAQNFDLNQVKSVLNWNAVKLTIGGLSLDDLEFILEMLSSREVKNLVIVLDLHIFNSTSKGTVKFFEFLGDRKILNDAPYWFSYDLWLKTFPKIILRQIVSSLGKPQMNTEFLEISRLGDWSGNFNFGKEVVKGNYLSGKYGVSRQNSKDMLIRMKSRFDCFFAEFTRKNASRKVIFIFPPYSALYWFGSMKEGSFDDLIKFKIYCIKKIGEYNGEYHSFDFQAMEMIADLDCYKDPTHYRSSINDLMVNCLKTGKYITDENKAIGDAERLDKVLSKFSSSNSDWLKP